jgi:hypothetical protein
LERALLVYATSRGDDDLHHGHTGNFRLLIRSGGIYPGVWIPRRKNGIP